jgi:hypothetical protein
VRKTGTPEEREGLKNFWPGAGRKRTLLPVGNQKAGWLQLIEQAVRREKRKSG